MMLFFMALLLLTWVFICILWIQIGIILFFINYVIVALSKGRVNFRTKNFVKTYDNIGNYLMFNVKKS